MKTHRHERSRAPLKPKSRKRPRYVITGGAGFVGANLAAALVARDPESEIVVIDDMRSGSFANIVEAFERKKLAPFSGVVLPISIADFEFEALLETSPVEALFHLAAITDTTVANEAEMLAVNSTPMMPIMHACIQAGVPMVYASSAATYGTPGEAGKHEPFPLEAAGSPNNVYGFSKWLMECDHRRVLREVGAGSSPQVVGLRYFNVFGPGESRKGKMSSMVYQLAKRMIAGQGPKLFRDGNQARDQVYVEDIVSCTMAGAGLGKREHPTPGVYNAGSGIATSFNEIVVALRNALGLSHGELPTEYFDMPAEIRAFYQDYTCADISKTAEGLGWEPAYRPDRGIEEYAKLLKSGAAR